MLSSSINPQDEKKADANLYVHKFMNKPLNDQKLQTLFASLNINHSSTITDIKSNQKTG